MLEPAGDLGLEQEPRPAYGIVGMMVEDLLQSDLAVQLGVERDKDRSQPTAGGGPQNAEPLAAGSGCADSEARRAVNIPVQRRLVD